MAAGATEWAWQHSRASNGPLLVLLAIAREIDAKGQEVEMSAAQIGRYARLADRAVRGAVKELERLGELSVTPRQGGVSRYALKATPADIAGVPRQNLHPGRICTPADIAGVVDKPRKKPQVSATPAESAALETSDVLSSTTGSEVVEVKEASEVAPERPDADRLCAYLASRIEANGSKRPNVTRKWKDAARLMLDKDGRTEENVMTAIDWCQDHEFWRSNILSMPKLREKYDQLRLQATREKKPGAQKSTTADRVRQAVDAGKRVQAMLNGES